MSRSLSYYKSQLKHAAKSGPQLVKLDNVRIFIGDDKKELKNNGKVGFVATFKNDDITHEELYWQMSSKAIKFVAFVDDNNLRNPDNEFWIVIRHNILLDHSQNEIKRESEIVHYSPEDKRPEYPQIYEEYDIAAI